MKIKSKFIFNLFLFFYLTFGIYISVNVGMTSDGLPNHNIGILNIEAIKDILGFNDTGYSNLEKFHWRYKGVAFYYLSYIYLFIVDLFFRLKFFPFATAYPSAIAVPDGESFLYL